MEAIANSVEDYLIDGLSFQLNKSASYVQSRSSVSCFPHGGNSYSPNGVKVMKFVLNGNSWLDPSTVAVAFTVNNLGTTAQQLRTLTGGWSFIRRVRVLAQGQCIEDIDYYNRVHQMMHNLTQTGNRDNDDIMGFSNRLDNLFNKPSELDPGVIAAERFPGLPGGKKRTIFFKPLIFSRKIRI